MKIALIHHRIPYPFTSGMDKVRYNLIRTLAGGYDVTLIAPVDETTSLTGIEQVEQLGCCVIPVPVKNRIKQISHSRGLYLARLFQLIINRLPTYVYNDYYSELNAMVKEVCRSGNYDIVQMMSDMTSVYLEQDYSNIIKLLGPIDDMVETARTDLRAATTVRKKIMWNLEYRACRHYQPENCKKYDGVFFFSASDQQRLAKIAHGLPNALILPVAVEIDDPIREISVTYIEPESDSVVFVGGMGSLFNQDAVNYFHDEILPIIRQKIPAIKFYVVGQSPPVSIIKLSQMENVIVTGTVEDVKPFIQNACVYIAPIRAGTGLKTKIVEALSFGKAIVSTSMGISGLWEVDQSAISIADQPEIFASEVIRLLRNPQIRKDMEKNALDLYHRAYSYTAVKPKTLKIYEDLLSGFSDGEQNFVRN